jgi:hypothetical protein
VARIDGTVMNSGNVCQWSGGRQRGIEGEWEVWEDLGFHGGASGMFL